MTTKVKRASAILTLCLVFISLAVRAQQVPLPQTGCSLINKSQEAQFITFEYKYDFIPRAKFGLHNNTSCAISVSGDCVLPERVTKLPNGGLKVERAGDSLNGVMLPLHYEVRDRAHGKIPEIGYEWGDTECGYEIKAGETIFFTVPMRNFENGLDLAVPFRYEWERTYTEVEHRVYFRNEELPHEVKQGLK